MSHVVGVSDRIVFSAWSLVSGATLRVFISVLRPNHTVELQSFVFTLGSTGALQNNTFIVPEGDLVSVCCFVESAAVVAGSVLVQARLERGVITAAQVLTILFRDFISTDHPLSFPGSSVVAHHHDVPNFFYTTVADPAVGAQFTFTPPANTRSVILGVRCTFTASAAAGTRTPSLLFNQGGVTRLAFFSGGNAGATSVNTYNFTNVGAYSNVAATVMMACFPPFELPSDGTLVSNVLAMDAADTWTAIRVYGKRMVLPD